MALDELEWGTWNAICDRCGLQTKANQLIDDVDRPGLKVHKHCRDFKNPQEFIRVRRTEAPIPWIRPDGVELDAPAFWSNNSSDAMYWSNSLPVQITWELG